MAFIGKEYAFVKQENFEEFVNALGLPAEQAQGFIKSHPNQKLLKDGDVFTLVTHKELDFKSGVPFEDTVMGHTCQTTITLDGNTLSQVQNYVDGTVEIVRAYSDSELVMTLTCSKYNGKATRYYKAL